MELKLSSLIVCLRLDDNCVNSLLTSRTEPLKVKWTELTHEIFQILMICFFLEMNFKIFSWNILKNNMKSFKGIENVKNDNTDVEGDNDDDDNDDDELFYHCPIEVGVDMHHAI